MSQKHGIQTRLTLTKKLKAILFVGGYIKAQFGSGGHTSDVKTYPGYIKRLFVDSPDFTKNNMANLFAKEYVKVKSGSGGSVL